MVNKKTQDFYDGLFEDDDHYGLRKYWNGWNGNFHRQRIRIFREIMKKIRVNKNTKIIEVGCGTSILGQLYSKNDMPLVTATDLSVNMVKRGKKYYPYINFIVDDAQKPKIKGKFDVVFSSEVIEHLPLPREAMINWTKLLKKGGFLVLSTPNGKLAKESKEHISLLRINEMKKLLGKNNLKLLAIYGVDLPIPGRRFVGRLMCNVSVLSVLSNLIFSIIMKFPKKFPGLAYDVFYVAKKI